MASGIDNLAAAIGRMSKRERYMVGGVSVVFVFFVGFLLTMSLGSSLRSMENRIEEKTKKLQKLIEYQASYEEAKRQRKEARRILREGKRIQLTSTVPNIAAELGFDVDNIKQRGPLTKNDRVDEENVEVRIKLITIDRLVDFLKRLESKTRTIAIRSLHVSNNFRQPDQLDVSFTVSNFKPKEGQLEESAKSGSSETYKAKAR